jgi:uncharacterized protein YcnI
VVAAAMLSMWMAGTALAHVGVSSPGATAGQPATLTVSVPNERAGREVTAVQLVFPESPAVTGVTLEPAPGWTASVERDGDVVRSISWTAGRIPARQSASFVFRVASLPEATTMRFVAVQTYDDGDVVRWEDTEAPLLIVAPAGTPTTTALPTTTSVVPSAPTNTGSTLGNPAEGRSDPDDGGGLGVTELVLIVLVVGGAAGGTAALVASRRRR